MKTAKLQELIEDTPTQIREEINSINIENNKMKNELIQKDNTIKKLKADLEKVRLSGEYTRNQCNVWAFAAGERPSWFIGGTSSEDDLSSWADCFFSSHFFCLFKGKYFRKCTFCFE